MMKRRALFSILFLVSISFLVLGCTNYNNEAYYAQEDEVLKDILPELMLGNNYIFLEDLVRDSLYIVVPDSMMGINHPLKVDFEDRAEALFENWQSRSDTSLKKEERVKFKPFDTGKLRTRELQTDIIDKTLPLIVMPSLEYYAPMYERLGDSIDGKEIGAFLSFSRIIVNEDKAYLFFAFYCGSGCANSESVEVSLAKDGKWRISKVYSSVVS